MTKIKQTDDDTNVLDKTQAGDDQAAPTAGSDAALQELVQEIEQDGGSEDDDNDDDDGEGSDQGGAL